MHTLTQLHVCCYTMYVRAQCTVCIGTISLGLHSNVCSYFGSILALVKKNKNRPFHAYSHIHITHQIIQIETNAGYDECYGQLLCDVRTEPKLYIQQMPWEQT